jgi:hypothetical protein
MEAVPQLIPFNREYRDRTFLGNVHIAYKTTKCHDPEAYNLNRHCRENLKTYTIRDEKEVTLRM